MNRSRSFTGTYTALVTPFRRGAIAYDDLRKLVAAQIKAGISGLVPVGTTGESPTVSHEEHLDIIRCTIDAARGRVPVIAGTGSNSTHEAIDLTKAADAAGADAFLLVAPYYNRPTQEGMFLHFAQIAETTDKPIILYSIPGRCGVEIGVPLIERLRAKYPHVAHIKEPAAASIALTRLSRPWATTSQCSAATTASPCPSWPSARKVSSAWRATFTPRKLASSSRSPSLMITRRPAPCTAGSIRCSSRSLSSPTPRP
jgi:dihydrodipicolinate synthase/N-acetylneuraminate lyase